MAAGAPKGNTNSASGKEGRRALELALEHYVPGKGIDYDNLKVIARVRTLIMMWEPIIRKAIDEGDLAAMKEINDRLDGRAAQSLTISCDEDNPITIKRVERVIVKPADTNG